MIPFDSLYMNSWLALCLSFLSSFYVKTLPFIFLYVCVIVLVGREVPVFLFGKRLLVNHMSTRIYLQHLSSSRKVLGER